MGIVKMIYSFDYVPSVHEFMTINDYNGFSNKVYQTYHVRTPISMKQIRTQIVITKSAYIVAFIIPIDEHRFKNSIYEIRSLGRWNEGQKYAPLKSVNYVAFANNGDHSYTILDSEEASFCSKSQFCVPKRPIISANTDVCAVCSYFDTNKDCCEYKKAEDNLPDILTFENVSFYSVNPLMPIELTVSCYSIERRGPGSFSKLILSNQGHFELDLSCKAVWNDVTIRTAITKFYQPLLKSKLPFTNYPSQDNSIFPDIDFDIKTLPDKRIYTKYLLPMFIIVCVVAGITVLLMPSLCVILKCCATNKILAFFTKYSSNDFKKLDVHRNKRNKTDKEIEKSSNQGVVTPYNSLGRPQKSKLKRAPSCKDEQIYDMHSRQPMRKLKYEHNDYDTIETFSSETNNISKELQMALKKLPIDPLPH